MPRRWGSRSKLHPTLTSKLHPTLNSELHPKFNSELHFKLNSELSLDQTLSAIDAGAFVLLNETSLELNPTLNSKLNPNPA